MDLPEFLLARVSELEAKAKAASDGRWYVESREPGVLTDESRADVLTAATSAPSFSVVYDEAFGGCSTTDAEHIVAWDPARVLAVCAALRLIVELHWPEERITGYRGNEPIREWQCPSCGGAGVDFDSGGNRFVDRWNDRAPCDTLLALARVHAGHPDFDPSWRV